MGGIKSEASTLENEDIESESTAQQPPDDNSCNVFDGAKKKKKKIGFREQRITEYENRV